MPAQAQLNIWAMTGTTYTLDETYTSLEPYYWRVDTVDGSGNVIKGSVYSFYVKRLAFPTAEGYGRYARGGQGGVVVHVTNLNDSGEGSLRWALCDEKWQEDEYEGVPRIIVFDVGGVINLESRLFPSNNCGDVYVAGQTAPGDGITVARYDFGFSGSNDVIIRDVRTRVGDYAGKSMGGMGLGSCDDSIIDHCSISWATDEGFSSRYAQNITFQWNIIGESLHDSVHYGEGHQGTETHAFAASISGDIGSFHHNLLIDCTGRNWSLAGAMEQDAKTYGGSLDIRNNVVYNWMDRTTDGGARRVNFVNNYYKAGAVSKTDMHIVSVDGNELGTYDMQRLYAVGNVMLDTSGNYLLKASDDAWAKGKAKSGGKNSTNDDVRSNEEFFESYVETESAEDAYKSVIANVGAGGYPTSSNFEHSTDGMCNEKNDTDRDGMPNTWEQEHGLDPNDASDGAICTLSADGYTNVEMFLNEQMGDPVEFTEINRDPIECVLISSLETSTATKYSSWSIDTSLAVGDQVFGDRTGEKLMTFATVPDELIGAEYVMTPCDAKTLTTDIAIVTAGTDITLYVGLDSRTISQYGVPSWMSKWTDSGLVVTQSTGVSFNMYSINLAKGESVTLGPNGGSAGCVFYTVMATAAGTSSKVIGDVNADGKFSIADPVMLQKWLVNAGDITDLNAGDMNGDNHVNVFDLSLMKKTLSNISSSVTTPSAPTTPTVPYDERTFSFDVKDGLFNQSNTDTLGLSYPDGLQTYTVWKAEESGDHYCNGVCLTGYKGKLYCMWQSSAKDEDSADTRVMYAVSSDQGKTWSTPQQLVQDITVAGVNSDETAYCSSGGWLATEDQLVAYINVWPGIDPRGGYTYYMTSKDGISWTDPQPVMMADGTPMNAVFEQDPHVLSTGRIVNAAHFQEGLIVSPIYTDDPNGISGWKKGNFTPTVSGSTSTEMEPSLFVQSDGTLAMIFRDQSSSYTKLVSYSFDDGATWSKVQQTDMPDARTKQSAGNLSDGTAFMAGSPVNNKLRSPLAITLSADGKTFDRAYLLRSNSSDPALVYEGTAKREGFHYTKSLVYDGYLYVGYATNKEAVEISVVPEESIMMNVN